MKIYMSIKPEPFWKSSTSNKSTHAIRIEVRESSRWPNFESSMKRHVLGIIFRSTRLQDINHVRQVIRRPRSHSTCHEDSSV